MHIDSKRCLLKDSLRPFIITISSTTAREIYKENGEELLDDVRAKLHSPFRR